MEREAREYAIIKSHSDFLKGMMEDEAVRKRNSLNYFVKTAQTSLKRKMTRLIYEE
ncbi:MAG TPA: hypothetical protein VEL11_14440 [Candidatus Bathyarchaeia archaeon]|nr:hypothetical protein [Candidatus Bathyarchaeia archaeon]